MSRETIIRVKFCIFSSPCRFQVSPPLGPELFNTISPCIYMYLYPYPEDTHENLTTIPDWKELLAACERGSSIRPSFATGAQKTVLSFSYCRFSSMLDHDNFGNCVYHPVWGNVLG